MERYEAHMRGALALAERGWGRVSPNPMVGAVALDRNGDVVGEGWHEGPGTPHAEVMALREAGDRARGGTLVVTLEPCNHAGRTGPCANALIDAGVAHVVVATPDVNPDVRGGGAETLRSAGIGVQVGVLADEARRLNAAFERHVTTGRPYVVLKSAASLDGRTAASDGSSRWITSDEARADAHRLRAWSDAVVVGAGTAIADDPSLTVRVPGLEAARPPLRVVVDATGRVSVPRRLFDRAAPTLVATTHRAPDDRIGAWEAAGAEVLVLDDDGGTVALEPLLEALGKRDVQGVLVEGGATLAWSFVRDRLVDRVVVYLAPKLVGGASAPGILAGDGFAPIAAALAVRFTAVTPMGPDLKVEADVQRDR
ncbi:MAG TPA: bifunctional diaminohydroxyphosphoribosylaminopyrimidine deaminase/5-amino-6-(5-phosphoribosylamino)uracil reductase RibD [Actinomycetota bacterium]|nr:bifunctional diaminohydroxyphosphoribosylaminopyrimidine deaminase/5-amino-6-(5-phosphoribosylamino)uracil reductase RibD [Actinomycetota bacterium]